MQHSLCDSEFYPLIHVGAKWMTWDEKVVYREKHGIPRTIDEWIADGKTRTMAPTSNPHKRAPSGEYPLWQDDVECILNVICKEELHESNVPNPSEFTLTLRVRVPPTTGFLMHYWHSPSVVIDQCTRDSSRKILPDWLETVQTERRFWQSRPLMLQMVLYFARNIPHNSRVSKRVASWCSAMSIPASDLLPRIRPPRHFYPRSPYNKRSHKPRASDLSVKESQKLRKILNKGSPLRKKKCIRSPKL